MNGWVKHFADGSKEEGFDHLVKARKASWSKGRLTDIVKVTMVHGYMEMSLTGTGEFWQSDTFEARVLVNEGQIVERTLYKRLHSQDRFIMWKRGIQTEMPLEINIQPDLNTLGMSFRGTFHDEIGKWLIMRMTKKNFLWEIGDR
jgi:hypothetical protein